MDESVCELAHRQPFVLVLFPLTVFRVLIGRYKEGKHKMWGWYYFRWWLVQRLIYYIPLVYLRGSPVLNLYFRMMGGKIGRNVFLNTHHIEAPDLVEIGDDSSIGIDAQIVNFHVENNWLFIRSVRIGACCYVGARSVVSGGSSMASHSQLGSMSLLTQGARVPRWEHWRGSPAMRTARVENYMPRHMARPGAFVAQETHGVHEDSDAGKKQQRTKGNGVNGNGRHYEHSITDSSLTSAQQAALYDHDDEPELPKKKQNGHGFPSGDLSEHLLTPTDEENSGHMSYDANSAYIGVGEESIAWHAARPSASSRFLLGVGQSLVLTILLPCMVLIALLPGLYLLHRLMPIDLSVDTTRSETAAFLQYLAASGPMAIGFNVLLCWQITVIKWALIGQIQPGDYKIHSWFYLRKWTVDTLMQLSIQAMHPLYSTVFLVPWFRSLGAIIGERCEIATVVYAAPDLIEIGDGRSRRHRTSENV